MEKEEFMEDFIDRLLEFYRISINEDEETRRQYQEMVDISQKFYEELNEKCPELEERLNEVMDKRASRDIEEQKYIYRQGVKDTISLLKKLEIL